MGILQDCLVLVDVRPYFSPVKKAKKKLKKGEPNTETMGAVVLGTLSLVLSVLLAMFGYQVASGNVTFAIIAASNKWDTSEKSRCLFVAAVVYLCIGLLCFFKDAIQRLFGGKGRWSVPVSRQASRLHDSSPLLRPKS